MGTIELLLIALGLSMDAFAVGAANGMCMRRVRPRDSFLIAGAFGLFQGLMPTAGYLLGFAFAGYIRAIDHIIALVLLGIIGGKMIYEALSAKKEEEFCAVDGWKLTGKVLLMQAVATSIDALAVGVGFAAMDVNILHAATFIAIITFALSLAAVWIGNRFGGLLNNKAELLGGVILVGIGIKIFVEHTFFGG